MLENIDQQLEKMPQPEFVEASPNSKIAFTFNEMPIGLTINWQWVLAKIGEALIAGNGREVMKLLLCDLDYVQINNNAVSDIYNIVRQPFEEKVFREVQTKIAVVKELIIEYLYHPQNNHHQLNYALNDLSFVLKKLKSLEIVGVGAFMIASGFQLALLQEKAKLDTTEWSNVKNRAIEYSDYAIKVSPKLFRLSVGRIDKECKCTRSESAPEGEERITEYECRYFDGKDLYLFRETSPNAAAIACNKHRLENFHKVADIVNQTAAKPVREVSKKWLEWAASI